MSALIDRDRLAEYMETVLGHMRADMLAAGNEAYLRGYKSAIAEVRKAIPMPPVYDAAPDMAEALEGLLDAIFAQDHRGDRLLTITGPTASLKWLLEAEEEARAALAKARGQA